jgi:hypothetical protein
MAGDLEAEVVDPHHAAFAGPGGVEHLAQQGRPVQVGLHGLSHRLSTSSGLAFQSPVSSSWSRTPISAMCIGAVAVSAHKQHRSGTGTRVIVAVAFMFSPATPAPPAS